MHDDYTPRHLRGLPERANLSAEEEHELMDLRTDLDRDRRRREAQRDPSAPEPWDFPVPRPVALLFDRLPSPFTVEQAVEAGAALDLDEAGLADALAELRRRELVSKAGSDPSAPTGDGSPFYIKHPEAKNWF